MTEQFIRIVRVSVGLPGATGRLFTTEPPNALRIAFSTKLNTRKFPNKTSMTFYNLSQDSIDFMSTRGNVFILEVGYRGTGTSILAVGDGGDVDTMRTETEDITTVKVGDAETQYLGARLNKTFGNGTTSTEVINAVRQEMDLDLGFCDPELSVITYPHGFTACGAARETIDAVIADIGLGAEWSIQGGAIQILGSNAKPTKDRAVLLTPTTGLLSAKKVKKGTEIRALLNANIKPGRLLSVRGRTVSGFFVARTVQVEGDGFDAAGPFVSIIKARRLG